MKRGKWIIVLCVILLLVSCKAGRGHFEDGSIHLEKVINEINEKSMEADWEFPILNETPWEATQVSQQYALDMKRINSSYVVSSVLSAQLGEISFFNAKEEVDQALKEAANGRLTALQGEWNQTLYEADEILAEAKMGRIGQYYYLIVGRDAQKVVNYIQSLT